MEIDNSDALCLKATGHWGFDGLCGGKSIIRENLVVMVNSLKDKEEGEDSMCEIMENLMEKRRIDLARKAIKEGKNSIEDISRILDLPLSTVQELASSMTDSKAKQA